MPIAQSFSGAKEKLEVADDEEFVGTDGWIRATFMSPALAFVNQ
jgi:hypothetical protein